MGFAARVTDHLFTSWERESVLAVVRQIRLGRVRTGQSANAHLTFGRDDDGPMGERVRRDRREHDGVHRRMDDGTAS